jgi:hypothetical protein
MVLGWLKKKQDPFKGKSPQAMVDLFEKDLLHHDDLLFGVGLFFECIALLYAGREDLIQTYRKQFRNMLQQGQQVSNAARDLINRATQDPDALALIPEFQFPLFDGLPEPEKMAARCELLTGAYGQIFPGRPRTQPLKDDDVFALVQVAAEKMAALPADA